VTDRIYSNRRVIDLSRSAAEELGMIRRGVARVELTPV
jgi:rare lipoprotein A (peptidoglycan hydrolase)